MSNGGSGEDDDAAQWTDRNDDVDVSPFTGRSGLQAKPPVGKVPLFLQVNLPRLWLICSLWRTIDMPCRPVLIHIDVDHICGAGSLKT